MDMQQLRQQYPQYNSLPDGELAFRLWNKDYKGRVPMGQFADSLKLDKSGFDQMISFARSTGYEPTGEVGERQPIGAGQGIARSGLQGATFGFGDEMVGAMAGGARALSNVAQGQPANLSQEVGRFTAQERESLGQFREESPKTAIASEIGGAVASSLVAPSVRAVEALSPVSRAAVTGGLQGAAYGAGAAEGGAVERAKGAIEVGIPAAVFGGATQAVIGAATPRVAAIFRRSVERPSVDTLRAAKNAAYQAVDDSGLTFDQGAIQNLASKARQIAGDFDYIDDPAVNPGTYAALRILDRRGQAKETTIGQLDNLRQSMWTRYTASKEPAILDIVNEIDDMIEAFPATNDLMAAARLANSRYKKAELLDDAMQKAMLQTASTGSGGNILNKYKQAVTSILTNKKVSRFFNDAEKAQMEAFVKGTAGENIMRKIGKLSPNGNGLMQALNIGAIVYNPAMAAVTVAGAGAKEIADSAGERAMQGILNTVSGVPLRPASSGYIPGMPAGVASGITQARGQ